MRELLLKALFAELFDPKVIGEKGARQMIMLGNAEQIAAVVRRFSPTARRSMEHPHPNEGFGIVA